MHEKLRQEDRGFTLIELVVVLAIIGIMIAAAVPLYLGARLKAYKAEASNALQEEKTMEWAYYQQYNSFGGTLATIGFTPPNSANWSYAAPTAGTGAVTMTAVGLGTSPVTGKTVSVILSTDGSSSSGANY